MREYKFRGWNGERMFYGSSYDLFYGLDDGIIYDIMQYTGIKDRNNKDIYEGDILNTVAKFSFKCDMIVEFENGCFVAYNENKRYQLNPWGFCIFEVVGNIYEKKETVQC